MRPASMLERGGGGPLAAAWTLGVCCWWDAWDVGTQEHLTFKAQRWKKHGMVRFRDGLGRMEGKLHGSRFVFHVVG
jgi:hypothetical protein